MVKNRRPACTDKKKATRKMFYVACSEGGYRINGLAFGDQKESPMVIALKEYRKHIHSPVAMIFIFPSADSYYLEEMPIEHYLSPEIKIKRERVRCHSHQKDPWKEAPPIAMKNGLPECFRCREEIIIAAIMG